MAEVDTSIYAPRPQQNPFDMITGIGKAADTLGNLAVGQSVQGAMGHDGEIDQNMLAKLLTQSPAGAMKAIPTLDALQKLKQAGFQTDQAGLETFQKRMAIVHGLFSGLASKEKPTIDDVHEIAARALDPALDAKKYGITFPLIMNVIKGFRGPDGKPLPSDQIRKKVLEIQTQAAHTAEILSQHSPQHTLVDQGGQYTLVPTGTRQSPAFGTAIPKGLGPETPEYPAEGGAPVRRGEQPPIPGGGVVGPGGIPIVPSLPSRRMTPPPSRSANPPGFEHATQGIAEQSATSANALTRAADEAPNTKALLGNLEEDLNHFVSGPGADWTKFAKAAANRNLPIPESWKKEGAVFDEKSIASQEKFAKTAEMITQAQFKAMGGTGATAHLESNSKTSPNDALSKLGNKGIIYYLKGAADWPVAKNDAWLNWLENGNPDRPAAPHGPNTFAQFQQNFNKTFDPRAFMFKYIPAKERQSYVDAMGDDERQQFLHNLTHARKQGWIKFDAPAAPASFKERFGYK